MKGQNMNARSSEIAPFLYLKTAGHVSRIAIFGALLCLVISPAQAQTSGKKAYPLKGKVEQVNTSSKTLTVTNEPIEGWMGAMTMTYPVDKPDVLKMVKVGDQIMATVYDGDTTLHNVMTMPAEKSDKQKSKK